jgi:trehalose 6-phosphate synthase
VLAGLYRTARVGLVTPLRDGMNLVSKEYIAAQDPTDPGVLILSRFAGAAVEGKRALLVNPYDAESVAVAIAQALAMPLDERRERHAALLHGMENNVDKWQKDFLDALRSEDRDAEEIRAATQTPTLDLPGTGRSRIISGAAPQGRA